MNILIADDDKVSLTILEKQIRDWGHEPIIANDGHEALYYIMQDNIHIDAILLDWEMPGVSGIEICKRVRAYDNIKNIPSYIIILTGHSTPAHLKEALEAGADDFMSKPVSSIELRARLGVGLRNIYLHTRLQQALNNLEYKANHDPLTKLLNRGAIHERYPAELDRAIRNEECFSVGLIDIDHFKQINDTYGHDVGDKIIQEVANTIRASFRPYDLVGRWGGEEFVVIAVCKSCTSIAEVYDRLHDAIRNLVINVRGVDHNVTVSAGVTVVKSKEGTDLDSVVKKADIALYQSKESGRDRMTIDCNSREFINPTDSDE